MKRCGSCPGPVWIQASSPQPQHLLGDPHQGSAQRTQAWLGLSLCKTHQMGWFYPQHTYVQAAPLHRDCRVNTQWKLLMELLIYTHTWTVSYMQWWNANITKETNVTALVILSGLKALIMHNFCREFLFFHSWGNFSFSGHSLSTNFFHLLADPCTKYDYY